MKNCSRLDKSGHTKVTNICGLQKQIDVPILQVKCLLYFLFLCWFSLCF